MWSTNILDYHFSLNPSDERLPDGITWLHPYDDPETRRCMEAFYGRYYDDDHPRVLLLGINPGRFGAGITGVPFTDPVRLEEICGIKNEFKKRQELSSLFVYDMVEAMGGPKVFFGKYLITSICPLGFVKGGKNFNYYDSKALQEAVLPLIMENLRKMQEFGGVTSEVFSMGKGKNMKFLEKLNEECALYDKVTALPHPRWVMQYRLKRKQEFVDSYVNALSTAANNQ